MDSKKIIGILGAIVLLLILGCLPMIVERVDTSDIAVIQYPNGTVEIFNTPGWKPQWFGTVTRYQKSEQFSFSSDADQGSKIDESIGIRFNDSGTGKVSGVLRYVLPYADKDKMLKIHNTYRDPERVSQTLIRPVIQNSIMMTGSLMSSREAFTTGNSKLIQYITDQAKNGIFWRSIKKEKRKAIDGTEETVDVESVIPDASAPGGFIRVAPSPVAEYGVNLDMITIDNVAPDERVRGQIEEQQKIIMGVQTAIAEAQKAEQQKQTAIKQGEANAATKEWAAKALKVEAEVDAEKAKAVAVTKAQQDYDVYVKKAEQAKQVANLDKDAAEFTKQRDILLGEGEATRRKLVMEADNALELKANTWLKINEAFATAIRDHQGPIVPSIMMGGKDGASGSPLGVTELLQLFAVKSAKDLQLDMNLDAPHKKK